MSTYTYIEIPFDGSLPLVEHSAACTVFEDDSLKRAVASYFAAEEAAAPRAQLDALQAAREREFLASLSQAGVAIAPEALSSAAAPRPNAVDINLLTAPRAPDFVSASFYGDPSASAKGRPLNARAMALCRAVGLPATTEIRGTVFLGRVCDNEAGDVWERRSVALAEAQPEAAWCRAARAANAGRDLSAFSSAGLMSQLGGASAGASGGSGGGGAKLLEAVDKNAWKESAAGDPTAYSWRRRTPGEIEVRVPLPSAALRARDLAVTLTSTHLGYKVRGEGAAPVAGPLGAPGGGRLTGKIVVDESSWEVEGGVLQFTLALRDTGAGETSSFAWPKVFECELEK